MRFTVPLSLAAAALAVLGFNWGSEQPPRIGPATEKRFPPLQLPKGFQATLFACDPLIEYPSAVAAGPRPGAIFVAVDYMTGLGTEIVRRDEVRLVEDTDGDGYADRAAVYAAGFNSIQGLAYHGGTVYVMHAPFLTALRDTDGDGKADQRRDLLSGLGLRPEDNPPRLHCANGVVAGHDGWLYLALGDHGCDVPRPEGDRLVLQGGGILRCRPDGGDLHVFATGLRNIYDVALDEELNVFVRDNENDGGDYLVRVCHSFFGADHGYPYLYHERPQEALAPLTDLGRGSSAGGLCYLETVFPAEYRGNLFFCEWGRAVVRYRPQHTGSSFAPLEEIEFAAGAEKDPYGFKPTDLVVQRDGSLIVADWADGQRPKRGRGRLYRITHAGEPKPLTPTLSPRERVGVREADAPPDRSLSAWLAQLDAESYFARRDAQAALENSGPKATMALREALAKGRLGVLGRLHAVWILAHPSPHSLLWEGKGRDEGKGQEAIDDLLELARTDPEPRVRAQAVRAVGDLADPVFSQHRLEAGRGDARLAGRLGALARGQGPRVLLEVVIALGRLRWPEAPNWLADNLPQPDAALAHAAMQTLRQADNWPAVLKLLDRPNAAPIRALALRALAGRADATVVAGLIERLGTEPDPARRRDYADALTRVFQKPGPWVYWGYRPPPRPPNPATWERTEAIEKALDRVLADPDHTVRLAVLRRLQREKVPTRLSTLGQWLKEETEPDRLLAILDSLREQPAGSARQLLESVVTQKKHPAAIRQAALAILVGGLDAANEVRLLALAGLLEDGPVLAESLRQLGQRPRLKSPVLLLGKLKSPDAGVRAAALAALGDLQVAEAAQVVGQLLEDQDAGVRAAAASTAGKLGAVAARGTLLNLAKDASPAVRRASLDALRRLKEPQVVPLAVAMLTDRETQATALQCIAEQGGPDQAHAVAKLARQNPSAEVLPLAVGMLSQWSLETAGPKRVELERAIAELQGASGVLLRWRITGPLAARAAPSVVEQFASVPNKSAVKWPTVIGAGTEARLRPGSAQSAPADEVWLACTDVILPEPATLQFLGSASGKWRIWLNGRLVYQRAEARPFQPDSDRFDATLNKGPNHLLVEVAPEKRNADFHLRFRRKSSTADREKLVQAALTRSGDASRGRKLFFDAARSQCLKCHRLGDQGERIGPDLTGVGNRFARVYLIEAILEPSRTIAPGYESQVVLLKDGRLLTGTRVAETAATLTLGDSQGQKHVLAKADLEQVRAQPVSIMPEGLEKLLTTDDFVDLIGFLASQK